MGCILGTVDVRRGSEVGKVESWGVRGKREWVLGGVVKESWGV